MSRILNLTVNYQTFERAKSGEQKEVYCKQTPYWKKRLSSRTYDSVCLHRGCTEDSISFNFSEIKFGIGRSEWGAEKDETVFVVTLGQRILSLKERLEDAENRAVKMVIDRELHGNKCLADYYSEEELTRMGYIPAVFTETIWYYINRVLTTCRIYFIEDTKKLSRAVIELREDYYHWLDKSIDRSHLDKIRECYKKFEGEFGADMARSWFAIKEEMEKEHPTAQYQELRIDAYCAILLVRALKRFCIEYESDIKKRLKRNDIKLMNRRIENLDIIMEGFVGNYTIDMTPSIRMHEDLILRDIKTIRLE